jgi:hypothetical protein
VASRYDDQRAAGPLSIAVSPDGLTIDVANASDFPDSPVNPDFDDGDGWNPRSGQAEPDRLANTI